MTSPLHCKLHHCKHTDYSPFLHYHSLPLLLLSSRHATCIISSRRRRRAAISCIPLLPSLPFAAINNWFRRNFHVSRLFFSWLCKTIASYTIIHSGCPEGCSITIALHRCAFIINYTYTSTINQLKHHFASGNMEKITLGRGLEPNIALGYASCYVSLSTAPSCYFFHITLAAVL